MEKTIKISEEAHEALMQIGGKGETFTDIILRLTKKTGDSNGQEKRNPN